MRKGDQELTTTHKNDDPVRPELTENGDPGRQKVAGSSFLGNSQ